VTFVRCPYTLFFYLYLPDFFFKHLITQFIWVILNGKPLLTCPFQTVVTFRYVRLVRLKHIFPIRPKQPTTISRHHLDPKWRTSHRLLLLLSLTNTSTTRTTKLLSDECGTFSAEILFSWHNTKYYIYI